VLGIEPERVMDGRFIWGREARPSADLDVMLSEAKHL
jgi:hypothetical protein